MKRSLTVLAAAVFALPAQAAPSLESAASDIPGALKTLGKSAAQDGAAIQAAAISNIWHDTECMDVEFKAGEGALSNIHMITSRTWIEECRSIPMPNPPGGGICIPERRQWSHVASFRLEVVGRAPESPREVFEICMTGPWLKFKKAKVSPHRYDAEEVKDGEITRLRLTKKQTKK